MIVSNSSSLAPTSNATPAEKTQKNLKVAIAIFAAMAVGLAVAAPFTAVVLFVPALICAVIALGLGLYVNSVKSGKEFKQNTSADYVDFEKELADSAAAIVKRESDHQAAMTQVIVEAIETRKELGLPEVLLAGPVVSHSSPAQTQKNSHTAKVHRPDPFGEGDVEGSSHSLKDVLKGLSEQIRNAPEDS